MNEALVAPETQSGWIDRMKGWASGEEFAARLQELKTQAEALAGSLMTLFTLFLFEALLFPLLSLWLLLKLLSGVLPRPQT